MTPRAPHPLNPSRARLLALFALGALSGVSHASDCTQTGIGYTPLTQLGSGLYLGQFSGGLYPAGRNTMPLFHLNEGLKGAQLIQPRNSAGQPDANGRIVLLSIGMSNTTQEWCSQNSPLSCDPWSFSGQAAASPLVEHTRLLIADGARGGQTASTWDNPTDPNYNGVRDQILTPQGVTEAQVQAIWLKVANAQPSIALPAANSDAFMLKAQSGSIVRACKVRYPNLQIVFFSTRIYAGYASSTLNPEPYAYESAFGAKWVIQAQIAQAAGSGVDSQAGDLSYANSPWIAWGPYLWADGLTPRSDGLTWACADFVADGTHPDTPGRTKVADMLMGYMLHSPFSSPWLRADHANPCPADFNFDGVVTPQDLFDFLAAFFTPLLPAADFNHSGTATAQDIFDFLTAYFAAAAGGCG